MSKNSPIPGKTPDQARRYVEAVERQAKHDALRPDEQLGKLALRPGKSRKERDRLKGQV